MAVTHIPVINAQLDKMNSLLGMIVEQKIEETANWHDIGELVRHGLAQDVFSIGDQLVTKWKDGETEYTIPMDIVHFGNVALSDGEVVPGMYLQWHYTTPFGVVFDPPEPDNADADIQQYGHNRWSQSAVRKWLNSEFLKGFSDDFLSQIKPVKIITQTNTVTDGGVTDITYDKFFLPSKNEEFLTVQATIDEGDVWEYWKRANSGVRPVNYQNYAAPIRYSVANHASAQTVWLRSAHRGSSCNEWYVYSNGYVTSNYARYALACAPACVIC